MGRHNTEEEEIETQNSNRCRKNFKKAPLNNSRRSKIKKILKKAEKMPLSNRDIYSVLSKEKNFLGIYSCDTLDGLSILNQPAFFIVNLDYSTEKGSHWIAIYVTKSNVEIFDSLGFNVSVWQTYPSPLIIFLNKYRHSHSFKVSPALQPINTFTCGLFCVYFIIYRNRLTFSDCVNKFSRNFVTNNRKLYALLTKF